MSVRFRWRRIKTAFAEDAWWKSFHQVMAMTSASATMSEPRDAVIPELVVSLGT